MGAVRWPETLSMLVAAIVGGNVGALGRALPQGVVRAFVLLLTAGITVAFFLRVR